jgi:hypothetical protein
MIVKTLRKLPDIFPLHDIRVIDGDTVEARIALPFGQSVMKRIRLKGWWADEPVGLYAPEGIRAMLRLKAFLEGKVIWLHAGSCREDKYGRVIGCLMHGERIITAKEVLGELQLTESVHKARRDQNDALGPRGRQVAPLSSHYPGDGETGPV